MTLQKEKIDNILADEKRREMIRESMKKIQEMINECKQCATKIRQIRDNQTQK